MDDTTLRLMVFFGVFAVMAVLEAMAPRRVRSAGRMGRWLTNWGMSIANSAVATAMKLALGAAAVLASLDAAEAGTGIFNAVDWPIWVEVVLVFLALDFAIWAQHLASHKIPVLWRIHRVHHADRDMDVTTAIRFHPIEIALSMGFKIALVYALGAPVWAVILFEIVLNASAMFNHANVRLPGWLDTRLRLAVVTPDMHRVHHSVHRSEHDANYGFNLAVWDRMFGTYIAQPRDGHDAMSVGLAAHQDSAPTRLAWSLAFPFRK